MSSEHCSFRNLRRSSTGDDSQPSARRTSMEQVNIIFGNSLLRQEGPCSAAGNDTCQYLLSRDQPSSCRCCRASPVVQRGQLRQEVDCVLQPAAWRAPTERQQPHHSMCHRECPGRPQEHGSMPRWRCKVLECGRGQKQVGSRAASCRCCVCCQVRGCIHQSTHGQQGMAGRTRHSCPVHGLRAPPTGCTAAAAQAPEPGCQCICR